VIKYTIKIKELAIKKQYISAQNNRNMEIE
jgi:hypothetical protein